MCYNKSLKADKSKLAERFKVKVGEEYEPYYRDNGFDHKLGPVITDANPDALSMLSWGLVPFWSKDSAYANQIRNQTLNAKSEEVFEKPSYKSPILKKRCLVLMDGMYEWMHLNGGKKKIPHYVFMKDHAPFAAAGIWETWKDPASGEVRNTYSILTTDSNPLMSRIHNSGERQLLILPPDLEKAWLDPSLKKDDIKQFFQIYPDDNMDAFPIAKIVDDQSAQVPFAYPELSQGSLF